MASVYQQINDICRTLVTTCLTALEKIQQGGDKRTFLLCARKASTENTRLVTFVKEYKTIYEAEKNELLQQTLKVKDVVVNLLTLLRSVHNTLVYGSTASSNNQQILVLKNELKVVMKSVGKAVHNLTLAENGKQEQDDPNRKQYAVECLDALSQMTEALRQRNREEFTASIRSVMTTANKLLSIRVSGISSDNRRDLRDNLMSLPSPAKMYFVNPDDEALQNNFYSVLEKVESAIRIYLPPGHVHVPTTVSPEENISDIPNIDNNIPDTISPLNNSQLTNSMMDSTPYTPTTINPQMESIGMINTREYTPTTINPQVESTVMINTREDRLPSDSVSGAHVSSSFASFSKSKPTSLNTSTQHEDDDPVRHRFGTHRRGDIFDARAINEILDDNVEEDDIETGDRDDDIDMDASQEFAQSIIEKVKITCPNDWEQLDAENRDIFEKHVKQVLLAHKRMVLALQAQSIAITGNQNTASYRGKINVVIPKTTKLVTSTISDLGNIWLKNSKSKPASIQHISPPDTLRLNLVKSLSEATAPLLAELHAFAVHFNDAANAYDKNGKADTLRDKSKDLNFRKRLIGFIKKLFELIKDATNIVRDIPKDSSLEKVKNRVVAEINLDREGTTLPIDESLLSKGQYCRYNKQCLLDAIYGTIDSILNLTSQLAAVVKTFYNFEESFHFSLLIISSCLNGVLCKTLDDIATFYYILQEEDRLKKFVAESPYQSSISISNEPEDTVESNKETDRPGTLNALIIRMTSSIFSQEHLNAFLAGYELFTSPPQVWEKLMERYNGPISPDKAPFVKMRCANIILHWLKKDMHSIDPGTLKKIESFASTTLLEDKFTNISEFILKELESPGRFEVKLDTKPPMKDLKLYNDLDPTRLLFMEDKLSIAEQMTLIDFDIYEKIAYIELTDGKWNENKEKLHMMARNVLNFIRRSNYIAFYVATNILVQKKLKDRVKMLVRFVGIAKCLAEMHNYNSLMGILVGLGQASIDRLKLTWSRVAAKNIETYRVLQQYFNPGNSFKYLREKLKHSGGNAIPYMGCVLGDLTFMDEGNPNFILEDNIKLINFPKLHLINRSITEIQQFQKTRYNNLQFKEPLHTFLQQMPVLQDRELYSLSLEREPRQANAI